MESQFGSRWFDGFWNPRFPGQISEKRQIAEPDLYEAIVALYPDRLNRGVLWNSAKAVMA